ncbi:MAG: RNA-binding S4 domain-containing protein [Lachnospiraceae bacterium]
MEIIKIKDDFIKLGQVLKLAGLVDSGVEAKIVINEGKVLVNGRTELQRGKKIVSGDMITYNNFQIKIEN